MSLAQRVRDFRYAKGWGPDELAHRAEISRTALYQIESGKTGLPRAGTLRRIAVALDVSMDALLGDEESPSPSSTASAAADWSQRGQRTPSMSRWLPSEGGPLNLPNAGSSIGFTTPGDDLRDRPRSTVESTQRAATVSESVLHREGELMSKLHDLLHSPIGSAVARVVDDLHGTLPRSRPQS